MRRDATRRNGGIREDELFQFYSGSAEPCPAGRLAGSLMPIYGETRRLLSSRESAARTERKLTSIGSETSAIQSTSSYREVTGEADEDDDREGRGQGEGGGERRQKFDFNSKMLRTLNRDSASYRRERAEYFNTPRRIPAVADGKEAEVDRDISAETT